MPTPELHFIDPPEEWRDPARCAVEIIPAPLERTTTYRKGTAEGPRAILAASYQVELYDEELDWEPAERGICTVAPLDLAPLSHREALGAVEAAVGAALDRGRLPFVLGGEHSLAPASFAAVQRRVPDVSVLYFDAHGDLREEYEGSRLNHACALRRIVETGARAVEVGVRSISREEVAFVRGGGQVRVIWAHQTGDALPEEALAHLGPRVYVSVDLDVFDPGQLPHVGNPEPGGLSWRQVLSIFRQVARQRAIVGMDMVELCPRPGSEPSDFFSAKLAYRMIGAILAGARG